MPDTANRLTENGETEEVQIDDIEAGDLLLVKPEKRCRWMEKLWKSQVDESMLTGRSVPVEKSIDDEVIGGSINRVRSIEVEKHERILPDTSYRHGQKVSAY